MKQLTNNKFILSLAIAGSLALSAQAQTTSVLADELTRPTKMILAKDDYLLVAEAGAALPNTGRVSIVDTTDGATQTLLEGLPSGLSGLGGAPEMSGPSALALRGNKLYVTIGSGDAMLNAGVPGLEAANPNPSSPLFNSVLELTLPGNFVRIDDGFTLSATDQAALASGAELVLTNDHQQRLKVRVVANLPDNVPNPRPDAPANLRASNVFGVEIHSDDLYIADASLNLVYRVDIGKGTWSTLATFPNKPNPLFPALGGPTVESVPNNVHRVGNSLLVPQLTGFPFVQGLSEVQSVNIKTGTRSTLISGLSSAMDIVSLGGDDYYTLEYSTNMLAGQPGRLRYYSSPTAMPITVTTDLVTPTSMVLNEDTGDIYVSEITTGRIILVEAL